MHRAGTLRVQTAADSARAARKSALSASCGSLFCEIDPLAGLSTRRSGAGAQGKASRRQTRAPRQLCTSYIDDEVLRAAHWRSLSQPTKASFPLAVYSVCPYRGNRESGHSGGSSSNRELAAADVFRSTRLHGRESRGGSFPPSVPQSRFATVLEHSCASVGGPSPSGRQSHRHRISSRGRGWHNDTDQPRETLHGVVAPPTQ